MDKILSFLKDLERNNNKEWFDNNRPRYEEAKKNFAYFVVYFNSGNQEF